MNLSKTACAAIVLLLLDNPAGLSQTLPLQPIVELLKTHRVWATPPATIQITGTSIRGNTKRPIKITATRQEELLIEYGEDKVVATSSVFFKDDGKKITRQPTPAGFTQLDIAGVFFLSQLTARPVSASILPGQVAGFGPSARRIHVTNKRAEMHYRQIPVRDEFDLYINEAGLLAGIARAFYDTLPRFKFTLGFTFSDYRDTNGVLMPYKIEKYVKGRRVETIVVVAYAFDVPAARSLFEPGRTR